jgi:outer membrane receptor protein involved in Fe transport
MLNNKVSKAVRLAIAFGAASTAAFTSSAFAAEEGAEAVERIEVTGSRIKRTDMEKASPVSVIDAAAISAAGVQNIGDLLRNTSSADLSGLTQMTNNTNANDGTQTISLRNLGDERSLVLVDGRRWLALGGGQVDISQIPLAIVERVEILTDGASAIYGSDAIAGVVNIITKKGFEGLDIEVGTGANFEGDGENRNGSLSLGLSSADGKSSLFFNMNKVEQEEIMAGDREISKYPVAGIPERYGSFYGLYGTFYVDGGYKSLDPAKEGAGMRTSDDFIAFNSKTHRYNYAPTNYLFTPSDRFSMFVKGDHEFNDDLRGFVQATFNQRKSVTQIAAVPLTVGLSGPQWDFAYSADNHYNPFGQDIPAFGFRALPVGPRTSIQDYDTYFLTAGLEGAFELADQTFYWDVAFSRGDSTRSEKGENYINLQNLKNAVGPSFVDAGGVAQCGTADNVIRGCVPLNLFNGETGFTDAMANYVGYSFNEITKAGSTDFVANISGELFELPAGFVGFAAGIQQRTTSFSDNPDAIIQAGLSSSNYREPTSGEQKAEEAYFEFAIPLLADLPAVQSLELSVAGRFSDFTNSGFVGTTPIESKFDNESFKVGFTWRVIDDLLIRGNYSDTFRAPSVNNLFSGGGEGFPQASDPCSTERFPTQSAAVQQRCLAAGVPAGGALQPTTQLRALNGGNPLLLPESGNTSTFGFVYNPSWVEGLDMSIDMFKVELQDALSTIGAQGMLNRCYQEGLTDACSLVERRPDGQVETVRTAQFNLSQLELSGTDFSVNYKTDVMDMGNLHFTLAGTYMDSYKEAGNDENISEATNRVGAVDSTILRWKGNFSTTWTMDDLSVTWNMRYIDGMTEGCWLPDTLVEQGLAEKDMCNARNVTSEDNPAGLNKIGSVVYHDLSASYQLPWDASVRVGLNNVFRKEPPVSLNAFANSFTGYHEIPGGTWFVRYKQSF